MSNKAQWLVIAAIVIAAIVFGPFLMEALIAWSLHSYFYRHLYLLGMPEYLSGMLAMWLSAGFVLLVPTLFAKHRIRWMAKVLAVTTVWYTIMHLGTAPWTNGIFSPFTGEARYGFVRLHDGKMEVLPLALKYHPDTGEAIQKFSVETAKEYQSLKSDGKVIERRRLGMWDMTSKEARPTLFEPGVLYTYNDGVWLEQMGMEGLAVVLSPKGDSYRTELAVIVKVPPGRIGTVETPMHSYLIDNEGRAYDYKDDDLDTQGLVRYIRKDETVRFKIFFRVLDPDITSLKLYSHRFEPLDITALLVAMPDARKNAR